MPRKHQKPAVPTIKEETPEPEVATRHGKVIVLPNSQCPPYSE